MKVFRFFSSFFPSKWKMTRGSRDLNGVKRNKRTLVRRSGEKDNKGTGYRKIEDS